MGKQHKSLTESLVEQIRNGSASFEIVSANSFTNHLPRAFAPFACISASPDAHSRDSLFFARVELPRRGTSPAMKKIEHYTVQKVRGDGRCMFRSLVKGMAANKGISLSPREEVEDADELRIAVKDALCRSDKERRAYEEALIAITVEESLKRYCQRIQHPNFWGGEPELLVLSKMCSQPIIVYIPESEVAETRFASHTIVLRRLVKVKEALKHMVISPQWGIWKNSNTARALNVRRMILDEDWWGLVSYVLEITDPIMAMLRFADSDEPCLGDIYDSMDSMLEKIKMVIQRRENDPEDTLYKKVEKIVHHRWNKMTTPLHLLAYALSPRYYSADVLRLPGRVPPFRDAEVADGYKRALAKIFQDPEIGAIVRSEFAAFNSGEDFDPIAIADQSRMGAIKWWYLHGQAFTYLQPLAIKVLSQVASSSAAERNWSTYSFIHSIKRNRLAPKKSEDLVFIHNNLRLLSRKDPKYKKGPEKLWDVAPETPDLDMTIRDLARSTLIDVDDEEEDYELTIPSTTSGLGSSTNTDAALAAHQYPSDADFLENPFDD